MTHCAIVPEFIFKELVEKTNNAEQKKIYQSMMTDVHNFVAGIGSMVLDGTAPHYFSANKDRNCLTHDCENRYQTPGKLVLNDKDSKHTIVDVEKAHAGAKLTHNFFKEIFGRNSLDDKHCSLNSSVRYGKNYNNAFFNPADNSMTYGEGDQRIFKSFVLTDIIGHEFSHGVVQHTANLRYYGASGASNESHADVFGAMIKQFSLRQKAEDADWVVGQGIFCEGINGVGIRHMLNPGTGYDDEKIGRDPQPAHMDKYYNGQEDNAGCHINSGILNRVFANVAIQFEGFSWEKAGKIWMNTLCKRLSKNSNFQDAANGWTAEAGELFGRNSKEQKIVVDCCRMVGLKPTV